MQAQALGGGQVRLAWLAASSMPVAPVLETSV
jgi:hypothetical protein